MFDPKSDFWGDDEHADIDYGVFPRARMHKKSWDQRLAALKLGRNICFGKGGGESAPTPDPQIGQAALEEADQGQQWLNFAQQQFDIGNQQQDAADQLTNQVTQQQLSAATQQQNEAKSEFNQYETTTVPLENQYAQTAQQYNTPAFQNEQAAQAGAAAQSAGAGANAANTRQMAAMGINPNSGKFQGITRAQNTQNALNVATAENGARANAQQTGLSLEANAVNMGNGLPAVSTNAAQVGIGAGSSAVANQNTEFSNSMALNGLMSQGYAGAMQGYAGEGGLLNSEYGNEISGYNAQQEAEAQSAAGLYSGIGSIVGSGVGIFAL